jgi:hypothetical protein
MAGRAIGYVQAVLTVAGFVMTLAFGLKFILWYLSHWSSLYGSQADPLETLTRVWRQLRWTLVGMGLFGLAWLWALVSSLGILRQARQVEASNAELKTK